MKLTDKTIVGLTGGIATGKSTVSNILKEKGFKIIDADKIAKDLMKKGNVSYINTVNLFGHSILDKNGEIDRKLLGKLVFNDSKLLKSLNNITHPDIFMEIKKQINASDRDIIFLDIPLLFEEYEKIKVAGIDFDSIWLVFADRESQINRIIARDRLTRREAINRIESQLSMDQKKEMADIVIYNTGSINKLKDKIYSLIKDIS